MPWVFTPITARSAELPGKRGSVEPAVAVRIVVPVRLLVQALSREKHEKPKSLSGSASKTRRKGERLVKPDQQKSLLPPGEEPPWEPDPRD